MFKNTRPTTADNAIFSRIRSAAVLAFTLMLIQAATAPDVSAQVWLDSINIASKKLTCTRSVSVRQGDLVIVEANLNIGPGGAAPTTMTVTTAGGQSLFLEPSRRSGRIEYLTYARGDQACAQIRKWDSGDSATVRIGIRPRTNLVPTAPVINGDGSVNFGFRVGDQPWSTAKRVVVELFFAQGRKAIGNPIAERTLLFGAFSAGDINIPLGSIPDPPAGTTHLLAWIDRFDQVPETDEGDNVAVTTLPNLKIAPPSYDAHNRISFGYSISSAAPVTSNRYVTVDLYYARGPKLGDRLPGIPPLRSSAISFRPGAKDNFILPPGEYPLPPEDASHLLAVIDQDRQVLEADKSDNVAARAIQIAPGYKPFRLHRGVRVYVRDVNQRPAFYLTVVDLDLANMRGNLREGGISYINHHWDDLERRNTRSHELAVVINGTFFQGVGRVIPGEISLGLKYDGRIVHRGARINDPTFLNVGVLTYADDTASIIPYKASGVIDPFQLMDNARYKSLVSVLPTISDVEADRRVERTWIALRDPVAGGLVGEPRFKTVVI
jgi:hypothetical protein